MFKTSQLLRVSYPRGPTTGLFNVRKGAERRTEQFTQFYYNTFDEKRENLASLYVREPNARRLDSCLYEILSKAWTIDADVRDGCCTRGRWDHWETFRSLASILITFLADGHFSHSPSPKSSTSFPLWMHNLRTSMVAFSWWWPGPYLYEKLWWPCLGPARIQSWPKRRWIGWHTRYCAGWWRAAANELHPSVSVASRWRRQLFHLQRYLQVDIWLVEHALLHQTNSGFNPKLTMLRFAVVYGPVALWKLSRLAACWPGAAKPFKTFFLEPMHLCLFFMLDLVLAVLLPPI